MELEVAFEPDEQVLAVGVDAPDRAPGQPLRPAVELMPRLGSQDLVRDPALEHGADPVGRPGDGVALGHEGQPTMSVRR